MINVAINGFGRIGRNILRALYERPDVASRMRIVAINDLGTPEINAHLLQFDTTHGRFGTPVTVEDGALVVGGDRIAVFAERNPEDLPWGDLNIDVVFECTGIFTSRYKAAAHARAGARKVLISAPSGDVALVAGSGTLRDHCERRMGFEQVMRTECQHLNVLPWIEGEEMAGVVEEKLSQLMADNSNIVGLYSLGGGTRGVIDTINSAKQKISVVTTELSKHTRAALISGTVDAVLVQDPGHEVRSAIRVLRALVDDAQINEKQERIRIEIFVRDNLP